MVNKPRVAKLEKRVGFYGGVLQRLEELCVGGLWLWSVFCTVGIFPILDGHYGI